MSALVAEKLTSEDGEYARGVWTMLGKMAFEMEGKANADQPQPQPQQDRT